MSSGKGLRSGLAQVCEQRRSLPGANLPRGSPALPPLPTVCQGAFLLPLLLQKGGASGEYPWQGTDIASQKHPRLWQGEERGSLSKCYCSDLSRDQQMKGEVEKIHGYFLGNKSRL